MGVENSMSYIIEKISQHAQHQPHAIAISSPDSAISYGSLIAQVQQLAETFTSAGYQCIGLISDNSINWALIDLACLQANICCIPVPGFFTPQQIQHLCVSAGVQALIGDADLVTSCTIDTQPNSYTGSLDIVICDLPGKPNFAAPELEHISKITFTSGSTGTPKGVRLTRDQIENTIKALDQNVVSGTSTRHLSVLPLVTLLENIAGLYLSLVQGAEILLYPMIQIGFNNLSSLDEKQFFNILNITKPQSLILVPELLRLLMFAVHKQYISADHFRFIAVGGGMVSETLLQQATHLGLPVLQGYGLSECASVVSLNSLHNNKPGSVGKPLQHVKIQIADDGEILIGGNIMAGYLGDEPNNLNWLATGDLGHLDEQGYLYVTGRKKNLLVTSFGKNISPEWVESVFLQSPLIKQIIVTGEASTHLRAIIVPTAATEATQLDHVINDINGSLPDYAKVREYQISTTPFQYENGLLTANGRMKRAAIAAHYI